MELNSVYYFFQIIFTVGEVCEMGYLTVVTRFILLQAVLFYDIHL